MSLDLGDFSFDGAEVTAAQDERNRKATYRRGDEKELASWMTLPRHEEIRSRHEAYDPTTKPTRYIENTFPFGVFYLFGTPESWKPGFRPEAPDPQARGYYMLHTRSPYRQNFGAMLVSHSLTQCYEQKNTPNEACPDLHLPRKLEDVPMRGVDDPLLSYFRTAEGGRCEGKDGPRYTRMIPFVYVSPTCADDCPGKPIEDLSRNHRDQNGKYIPHVPKWDPEVRYLPISDTVNKKLAVAYQARMDEAPDQWHDLTGKPLWIYKNKADMNDKKGKWDYYMTLLPTESINVDQYRAHDEENMPVNEGEMTKGHLLSIRKEVEKWMTGNHCEGINTSGRFTNLEQKVDGEAEKAVIAQLADDVVSVEQIPASNDVEWPDVMKMSDEEAAAFAEKLGIHVRKNQTRATLNRNIKAALSTEG